MQAVGSSAERTGISSSNFNDRSEEHTSELQSRVDLVCRLLLEKKNIAPLLLEFLEALRCPLVVGVGLRVVLIVGPGGPISPSVRSEHVLERSHLHLLRGHGRCL